ncbi:hypothetical protein N9L68_02360 [bacterium]|nr:hypothetical protein [bacterium]
MRRVLLFFYPREAVWQCCTCGARHDHGDLEVTWRCTTCAESIRPKRARRRAGTLSVRPGDATHRGGSARSAASGQAQRSAGDQTSPGAGRSTMYGSRRG